MESNLANFSLLSKLKRQGMTTGRRFWVSRNKVAVWEQAAG